jgi:hypothetical protein
MSVTQKVARNEGFPTPSPVPFLVSTTVTMVPGATIGPYSLYSGSCTIGSTLGTKYGVSNGPLSDTFKDAADLENTCEEINISPSSSYYIYSYPSTASSRSTSASSSPVSITTSQPPLDLRRAQHLGLNKLFEPTLSTEYTRVYSQTLPSITSWSDP